MVFLLPVLSGTLLVIEIIWLLYQVCLQLFVRAREGFCAEDPCKILLETLSGVEFEQGRHPPFQFFPDFTGFFTKPILNLPIIGSANLIMPISLLDIMRYTFIIFVGILLIYGLFKAVTRKVKQSRFDFLDSKTNHEMDDVFGNGVLDSAINAVIIGIIYGFFWSYHGLALGGSF